MMPYEGNRIDEEQIFLLGLDAPATEQSIAANAYCDIRGITERVPVRVIGGEERKTLLAARRDFVDRFLHVLFKDGREIVIDGRMFGKGTRFEQFLSADGDGRFPIAVLQCKRRLPNNAQFRLVWGKGIVSESGVPTSLDQVLAYEVRDTFQARFTCDRVTQGCAMPSDPADAAGIHGAGAASRGGKNRAEVPGKIDSSAIAGREECAGIRR